MQPHFTARPVRSRPTAIRSLALFLLAGLASTAVAQTSVPGRIPSPLPRMGDVKTPAPPTPAQDAEAPLARPAPLATSSKPDLARDPAAQSLRARRGPVALRQLYFDEPGDGALWARGASYKMRFDTSGATYAPRFGARAEKSFPLAFRLASATQGGADLAFDAHAAPARHGDSVAFDRGGIVERYDLGIETVEQVFVVDAPLGSGDLVLRIAVETELEGRAGADGLEFQGAPGFVRYGRATAIDAAGASVAAETSLAEGGIEIRVPSDFLAHARFPLVVDPVVATFPVDASTDNCYLPDVAYDATSDQYAVVFEIPFGGPDPDIYIEIWNAGGFFLYAQWIDSSFTSWARPRVASLPWSDQWLVVAEVGPAGSRTVWGRTVSAAGFNFGPQFQISGAESGEKIHPDVGGDPYPAPPNYYCVVWERVFSSTDHDVHARLVNDASGLVGPGTILIDNTSATIDAVPAISKSDAGVDWNIVWQRELSSSNHDIWGARVHWDGTITSGSFAIATSSSDETAPAVSSPLTNGQYLVTYLYLYLVFPPPNTRSVFGRLMMGNSSLQSLDLNEAEYKFTSQSGGEDHANPAVDSDGSSFAVAYSEQYGTSSTDYDIYVSTFRPIGLKLFVSEPHVNLAFSGTHEDHPRITSRNSGAGVAARFFSVWDEITLTGNLTDVEGALYDRGEFAHFCFPGYDGVMACPCGNPGAGIIRGCENSAMTGGSYFTASGAASLAADTLVFAATGLRPVGTAILLQGDGFSVGGVPFGQGVRCVSGNLRRLYVKPVVASAVTVPQAGDPTVSASSAALGDTLSNYAVRYYTLYYRDPTVLGACAASSTWNATTSGAVTWRM